MPRFLSGDEWLLGIFCPRLKPGVYPFRSPALWAGFFTLRYGLLRSPTTTDRDKKAAAYLAEITGLNIQRFGEELFNASSDLLKKTPEDIIKADYKIYEVGKERIGIGQIEVIEMLTFEKLREALLEALDKILYKERLTLACLLVSDIIYENSLLLFTGDATIITRMGYPVISPNLAELKGVLSRKKQLVPRILSALK